MLPYPTSFFHQIVTGYCNVDLYRQVLYIGLVRLFNKPWQTLEYELVCVGYECTSYSLGGGGVKNENVCFVCHRANKFGMHIIFLMTITNYVFNRVLTMVVRLILLLYCDVRFRGAQVILRIVYTVQMTETLK